ncbi:MAG: hypothetical protein HGN29_17705 [Asgard group archaeon]|nr:hypothetical protein [Asgard group archaeon]
MTTESVQQELEFKHTRILEINYGFLLLILFSIFSAVSALLFILHLWSSDETQLYKAVFAIELVKLVVITIAVFLLFYGLTKVEDYFEDKSRLLIRSTKFLVLVYFVVHFILSLIYLLYSFDHMSSEDVAGILANDFVSMLVLMIPFLLLSLSLQREFRTAKTRTLLSFQSIFTILSVPSSFFCFFLFVYADHSIRFHGEWQLYFLSEVKVSLAFFLLYSLFVILSSVFFILFINRLSKDALPSFKLRSNKNDNNYREVSNLEGEV